MRAKAINTIFLTISCLLFMPGAQAHTGIHTASGLAAGFFHPLTGFDHLLMALAAGYWAGQPGKRSGKGILFFLALLVTGLLLGALSLAYPSPLIAPILALFLTASVMITAIGVPHRFAQTFFGSFALYHGLAHILEMPVAVSVAGYTVGLLSSTALLLVIGIALRKMTVTRNSVSVERN